MSMKRALLLLLFLGMVLAGSALEIGDLNHVVGYNPIFIEETPTDVQIMVNVNPSKGVYAYNLTMSLYNLPPGITVIGDATKTFQSVMDMRQTWTVTATEPDTYDFADAFKVVSWDNAVTLEVDKQYEETGEKITTIRGWTDSDALCEKHNRSGSFWGDENNCQVRINAEVCNVDKLAESSGVFSFECDLKEGNNTIEIKATDPGENTAETTVYRYYEKPFFEKYGAMLIGVGVLMFLGGLVFVLKRMKDSQEQLVEETKQIVDEALAKEKLEDLLAAEKHLLKIYIQSLGGATGVIKQLIPIWEKIIEQDQRLWDAPIMDDYSALVLEANPYLKTVPPGVWYIVREQYNRLMRGRKGLSGK